jgi:tuftelin-interacting protein 11
MEWQSLLSTKHMVSLLETEFFTKWLQVLGLWLQHGPNFVELIQWYQGWKKMFSGKLIEQERIRAKFNQGLDMIAESVFSCSSSSV